MEKSNNKIIAYKIKRLSDGKFMSNGIDNWTRDGKIFTFSQIRKLIITHKSYRYKSMDIFNSELVEFIRIVIDLNDCERVAIEDIMEGLTI